MGLDSDTYEVNVLATLNKAFKRESKWVHKDEFLDVVYWGRQILGIIVGFFWGIFPFFGFLGLFLFCCINVAVTYLYYSSFQKVDEDEYGGPWEIIKEGFVTSFAGFLVMWIIVYSAVHFE